MVSMSPPGGGLADLPHVLAIPRIPNHARVIWDREHNRNGLISVFSIRARAENRYGVQAIGHMRRGQGKPEPRSAKLQPGRIRSELPRSRCKMLRSFVKSLEQSLARRLLHGFNSEYVAQFRRSALPGPVWRRGPNSFSLAVLPLVFAAGAAVDYSRASSERAKLQAALDAAVIAGAKDGTANWTSTAANVFTARFGSADGASTTFSVSNGVYTGTASASAPTAFVGIAEFKHIPIGATAAARSRRRRRWVLHPHLRSQSVRCGSNL